MKTSIFYVKHSPAITFPRHAPLIRPSCRARSRHVPTCAECRNTKKGTHLRCVPKGGDYLLFRFRSTIGVIRFNFSVRNGKRWSPYAVFALISFQKRTRPEAEKTPKHQFHIRSSKCFCFLRNFRAISTARLCASPRLHLRPIDVVVCDGPWNET